jgi:hypothetical protein
MKTFRLFPCALLVAWVLLFVKTSRGSEVEIVGDPAFKKRVAEALKLLREKSPEAYAVVKKYIGRIQQGERSGMWAERNPPTYEMSSRTAQHSLTWCAGTIAHDAYHSRLYHDYLKDQGKPPPHEYWAGAPAERKCIRFQLQVLRQIGAPANEVEYCRRLDGTHSDLDGDGKYDWADYYRRNW